MLKEHLKPVQADLGTLKASVETVTRKLDEISTLRTAVGQLEKQQKLVHAKVDNYEEKCKILEEKEIQLEACSMRNNLKLLNVARRQENYEDSEKLFIDICAKHGLNFDPRDIEKVYRVGPRGKGQRPLIVKFNNYKD